MGGGLYELDERYEFHEINKRLDRPPKFKSVINAAKYPQATL
jgi:hypothetical protein